MEAMTLAQVYVALRNNANDLQAAGTMPILAERLHGLADAIDAHLAQPAQAVDVGAVLVELRAAADQDGATMGQCFQWWRLLTRALSGEKAGPVGDGFDGERYTDMVDAYDEALRVGWNREQAMGCAIRAYYAAAPSQRAEVK